MVFEPALFDYLKDDDSSLEADALEQLAADKQLAAFRHEAFWQCMDTMREVRLLENLWRSSSPPWKVWS
jgi:glucose-1-phosphate cytidylyltransferase